MLACSQKFQESSLESRVTVNLLLCITADGSITGRGYKWKFTVYWHIMKTKEYIDLARAKSKALDNIYSLLKQNIKSWNAKWQRQ